MKDECGGSDPRGSLSESSQELPENETGKQGKCMTKYKFAYMLGSIPNPLNAARLNNKVCKDFIIDCDLKRKRAATGPTQNPIAAGTEHTHSAFSEYHSQEQNTI